MDGGNSVTLSISWFQAWIAAKLVAAVALVWWETRHNTYKPHQLVRRYLSHAILTEWTAFKFILGSCGWVCGKGFPSVLWPVRKPVGQNVCRVCKDTGVIKRGWGDRGRPCACTLTKQWDSQFAIDQKWRN